MKRTIQTLRRMLIGRSPGRTPVLTAAMAAVVIVALVSASTAGANGVPFSKGDVLADVGGGLIKHFSPTGTLLDTLETTTGTNEGDGMCFDKEGNLYATQGFIANTMSKFDVNGNLLVASFGSGFNEHPESCVFDGSNNMYVGQPDGSKQVLKFNTSGEPQGSFAPESESRGTDWLDLASDQCTLHYTSEGSQIKRFNVCTNEQLLPFATGLPAPCYAHRILASGEELVACASEVLLLSSTGAVLKTYPAVAYGSSYFFAMNLDPDGKTFWTADYFSGKITRIDIATGATVTSFSAPLVSVLGGIAIVGEITPQPKVELSPATAENPVGTTHTVTATVTESGVPQSGVTVTFTVTGVNPQTGTGTTNAAGEATFTYTGKNAGTDMIVASFVDKAGKTIESNPATKIWTGDQPISASGTTVSATEGASFSGTVATFSDPDTSATAGEYAATIEWGDGSSSTGTVSGSGGSFAVSGEHTYADEGSYTITVTTTDADNSSNSATATSSASVADAALTASGVSPAPVSPQSFSGTVANFTDANASSTAADFTATIDWGDGSPTSTGTVSGSGGSYGVSGSHTYAGTGYFTIKVHIVDDGGSTADATTQVLIFGSVKGGNFVIGDRNAATGTAVTFWGAQWWKANSLSGGSGPASFKGFEDNPAVASCGTSWTTDPGNSTPPPAGPLPGYMEVIVSSKISKSGSAISGNAPHLVVVKTNGGYAPNPGHAGTGTVVATIC
jgi:Bacterial Ig-like domain (group 1)